jgi:hypothetical protein
MTFGVFFPTLPTPSQTGICGWSTPGSDAAKVILLGEVLKRRWRGPAPPLRVTWGGPPSPLCVNGPPKKVGASSYSSSGQALRPTILLERTADAQFASGDVACSAPRRGADAPPAGEVGRGSSGSVLLSLTQTIGFLGCQSKIQNN